MTYANARRCARCGAVLRRSNDGELCQPCTRSTRSHTPTLPADFYTSPDVVDALAAYRFGEFFKIARVDLDLSQEQFGLLVGLAQSRVSKIENGVRLRDIGAVARVATVLDTPADLLGFATHVRPDDDARLVAAVAVVVKDDDVLLVRRRETDPSGLTWQFPAGIVKPGASAAGVAVAETMAETGIRCTIRAPLGSRLHPHTQVNCEYFVCDYLTGEIENRDVQENADALWASRADITRFLPAESVFPPVLRLLCG